MSVILGLNLMHADTAACLVVDGQLQLAVAEERLGDRIKHSSCFPENAVRRVLKESGLELRDVTHVAIARDPHANLGAKAAYVLRHPVSGGGAVYEHFRRNQKSHGLRWQLAETCGTQVESLTFDTIAVEHHLAHIASAYYLSPFDRLTAGWSYDASGDFVSAMAARCEGTKIEPLYRVMLPHSLGFFYTAICQFIGFDGFGEEYKVMGLASYGEDEYAEQMRKLLLIDESTWFRLGSGYFGMHDGGESGAADDAGRIIMGNLYTDKMQKLLGAPRRPGEPLTQRERNVAKSCQVRFEQAALHCLRRLHRLVPTDQLAMAGGCVLNGVANACISRQTPFGSMYLQPAASDDGTCLGAAYYVYHEVLGGMNRFHMDHPYWGPEYPDSEAFRTAEGSGVPYRRYDDDQLIDVVARYLHDSKVVGWYQSRSEWGPRSLGNRAILANPARPDMKDLINKKIKRRESFRPFAPTVLDESVSEIFEQYVRSPFMMHVAKIRPEWRTKLPAVTHVDGTGRLQSLRREENPRYYDLIKRFSGHSGVPAILNTSFNENEPIVDTPEQALACFQRTDMDVLVLGNYVLVKSGVAQQAA